MQTGRLYFSLLLFSVSIWGAGQQVWWQSAWVNLQASNASVENMEASGRNFIPMCFPATEINWLKDHEISWEGEKYDLKDMEIVGDTIYALAYHDYEEVALENKIADSHTKGQKKKSQRILSVFFVKPSESRVICQKRLTMVFQQPEPMVFSASEIPGVFIPPCNM